MSCCSAVFFGTNGMALARRLALRRSGFAWRFMDGSAPTARLSCLISNTLNGPAESTKLITHRNACAFVVRGRAGSVAADGGAEGIRTSDLRSVGAHALDGAAASEPGSTQVFGRNAQRGVIHRRLGEGEYVRLRRQGRGFQRD